MAEVRFKVADATIGGQARKVLHYRDQQVRLAGPAQDSFRTLPATLWPEVNFTRYWMSRYSSVDPPLDWTSGKPPHYPFAFAGGKWNLAHVSADFLAWLTHVVRRHRDAGQVVMVSIFNSFSLRIDTATNQAGWWETSAWNRAHNVNGALGAARGEAPADIPDALVPLWKFYNRPGTVLHDGDATTTLAAVQDQLITKIVQATDEWNVFYELANEPSSLPAIGRQHYVPWLAHVTGLIHDLTGGTRPIFHNDVHKLETIGSHTSHYDVEYWKATQPNYDKLAGVVLHGDVLAVDPKTLPFAGDKVLMASTDGYRAKEGTGLRRDHKDYNQLATAQLLGDAKQIIYEAFSLDVRAVQGIKAAVPDPTRLR